MFLLFFNAALLFWEFCLKSDTFKTLAPEGTPEELLGDGGAELLGDGDDFNVVLNDVLPLADTSTLNVGLDAGGDVFFR